MIDIGMTFNYLTLFEGLYFSKKKLDFQIYTLS